MLSSRSVIILVVALALFSLMGMLINLSAPPDQGGIGRNTYGIKAYGHRGLYELLESLKLPVRRGLVPPNVSAKSDDCLVFWDSDPGMVRIEPGHLAAVKSWLENGGQIIVAPARPERTSKPKGSRVPRRGLERDTSVLQELGLGGVQFAPLHKDASPPKPPASTSGSGDDNEQDEDFEAHLKKSLTTPVLTTVPVQFSGELNVLAPDVKNLAVEQADLQILDIDSQPAPSGTLTCRGSDGTEATLAARYHVGAGTVTVVSDPELFDNLALSKNADNAVLGAQLFNHGSAPVVFDEFYHGLTIRGNVFWLLTRPGYGILFAMLSLAVALWAWRQAVNLGPPLPQKAVTRRSVAEYVDAMARLFQRGNCQMALIRETRSGVLWAVARRLGLRTQTEDADRVALALERRDPAAAGRLRAAVANSDALLRGVRVPTEANIVEAMEQLRKCL